MTAMEIITDYTVLPELLADQSDFEWLSSLAMCFGPHLQKAIDGDAKQVEYILRYLSDIEKEALNRAEDWDENL